VASTIVGKTKVGRLLSHIAREVAMWGEIPSRKLVHGGFDCLKGNGEPSASHKHRTFCGIFRGIANEY